MENRGQSSHGLRVHPNADFLPYSSRVRSALKPPFWKSHSQIPDKAAPAARKLKIPKTLQPPTHASPSLDRGTFPNRNSRPPGMHGFLLSSAMTDGFRRAAPRHRSPLPGPPPADGRRFRWEVTRPRLCFFLDPRSPIAPIPAAVPHARKALPSPDPARPSRGRALLRIRLRPGQGPPALPGPGAAPSTRPMSAPPRAISWSARIRGACSSWTRPSRKGRRGALRRSAGRDPRPRPRPCGCSPWTWNARPARACYSISLYGGGHGGPESPGSRRALRASSCRIRPAPPAPSPDGYEARPDERSLLAGLPRRGARLRSRRPHRLERRQLRPALPGPALRTRRPVLRSRRGRPSRAPRTRRAAGRFGPQWLARVPGRAVLDGIAMLKAAFVEVEEGYSLAAVSHQVLGERKLIELEGEDEAGRNRPPLPGGQARPGALQPGGRAPGPCHLREAGALRAWPCARPSSPAWPWIAWAAASPPWTSSTCRACTARASWPTPRSAHAGGVVVPGGLVLEGSPGFFRNVLVLDFKSLYPSIIRTFMVDPLAAAAAEHGRLEGRAPWCAGPRARPSCARRPSCPASSSPCPRRASGPSAGATPPCRRPSKSS